jgi:hypothetical protein
MKTVRAVSTNCFSPRTVFSLLGSPSTCQLQRERKGGRVTRRSWTGSGKNGGVGRFHSLPRCMQPRVAAPRARTARSMRVRLASACWQHTRASVDPPGAGPPELLRTNEYAHVRIHGRAFACCPASLPSRVPLCP